MDNASTPSYSHRGALHYSLQLIRGTDRFGSPCYRYVLLPPGSSAEAGAPVPQDGLVIYSGWGEPGDHDTQAALAILRDEYLR